MNLRAFTDVDGCPTRAADAAAAVEVLQAAPVTVKHAHRETHSAADTPAIDRDKIAYFGICWCMKVG